MKYFYIFLVISFDLFSDLPIALSDRILVCKGVKNDLILIKNDSLFNINKDSILFRKKIFQNPKSNIDKIIFFDENLFGINSSGGEVFVLKNDNFIRIDNSFTHKNQLYSNLFVHRNRIYKFGGYGFFTGKNFITYFSNETKEWHVNPERNTEESPPGIFDFKWFYIKNELFVFGGTKVDIKNRNEFLENKELWRFSFVNEKWEKLGILNLENLKFSDFDFLIKDEFVFSHNSNLFSLNYKTFELKQFENYNVFNKINYKIPPIIHEGKVFFVQENLSKEQPSFHLNSFNFDSLKVNKSSFISLKNFYNLFWVSSIIIAVLITIILIFKIQKNLNRLKISGNFLKIKFNKIHLNNLEISFMKVFLKKLNEPLSNEELLDMIPNKFDRSHKTRIKNKLIEDLNYKLTFLGNDKFHIKRIQSNDDKRYFSYVFGVKD